MDISTRELRRQVKHFRDHWTTRCMEDSNRFRKMPDLATAIQVAARSETAEGNIENHQRRIGRPTLRKFERKLQRHRKAIHSCRDFKSLHSLINRLRIDGIGELAVYDIAQRIGEYLRVPPKEVYLHAGARTGARNLGFSENRIRVKDLPSSMQQLKPDQIESFLCIYKDCFVGCRKLPRPRGIGCGGGRSGGC